MNAVMNFFLSSLPLFNPVYNKYNVITVANPIVIVTHHKPVISLAKLPLAFPSNNSQII